jgi:hypothetical protein
MWVQLKENAISAKLAERRVPVVAVAQKVAPFAARHLSRCCAEHLIAMPHHPAPNLQWDAGKLVQGKSGSARNRTRLYARRRKALFAAVRKQFTNS